jgi:uncharacterized protein YggT (Ycf19 family)
MSLRFRLKMRGRQFSMASAFPMSAIDFILNIVGLLLWLNWRAVGNKPSVQPVLSLASTLKAAAPSGGRWLYLGMLAGLLWVRAFIYWQLGPALKWVPCVALGPVTLAFRSDLFMRMLVFSALSFLAALAIFYLWLLALSCLDARLPDNDPHRRFIQLHLGWLDELPGWIKWLLPIPVCIVFWLAAHPLLAALQMATRMSVWNLALQGMILGLAALVTLKYLFMAILGLHLLNSYVYLGGHPFWTYIDRTAGHLLSPIRRLPWIVGKIDLAPMAGLAVLTLIPWLASWASIR